VVRLLSATSSKRGAFSNKKRKKSKCIRQLNEQPSIGCLAPPRSRFTISAVIHHCSARVSEAVTKEERKKEEKKVF
jgi:hypothetical protein